MAASAARAAPTSISRRKSFDIRVEGFISDADRVAQCLGPSEPALVRAAEAVPQHAVANIGHCEAGLRMRESHAAARASVTEAASAQHRLDCARQLEPQAKSLRSRPRKRQQRSRRAESLVLRFARAFHRLARQQAYTVDLADAGGVHLCE